MVSGIVRTYTHGKGQKISGGLFEEREILLGKKGGGKVAGQECNFFYSSPCFIWVRCQNLSNSKVFTIGGASAGYSWTMVDNVFHFVGRKFFNIYKSGFRKIIFGL